MKNFQNAQSEWMGYLFCDMSDPQHIGGWTVIMRRIDRSPQRIFDRDWLDYVNGFGSMNWASSDYWMGNLFLYKFIKINGPCDLVLNVKFCSGEKVSRLYHNFSIENAMNRYRVTLVPQEQFEDGVSSINGSKFYAANLHNSVPNCGNTHGGGAWWWSDGLYCTKANFVGKLGCDVPYPTNMYWIKNDGKIEVMESVVMKIRPRT